MSPIKYIFFSGELPPESINGIAYSNASLVQYLSKKNSLIIDKEIVNIKYHKKFSFRKLMNFVQRIIFVSKNSYFKKFDYFYIVFSNSLQGSIKTLFIIYTFKLFNKKSKIIVHIHRGDLEENFKKIPLLKLIFKQILYASNKIIVLSNQLSNYINSTFHNKCDIFCLENTVFNETNISKQNQDNDVVNCIFISNYIEEKGILILLEAFKKLGFNYKLNCYGCFSDNSLKEIIINYQSDNIIINGPIYDLDKFKKISNSDLLILPSFNEGKPIILLESMMLGTPFIASKVGYINEIIDSDYPYLLDKINIDNIVKLVKSFSKLSFSEKKSLSNCLINRYNSKYSNKIYFDKINEIFR
jgi:glycosyltransferase involved in cell wall biosynthesis